jgi:hypothetical protein
MAEIEMDGIDTLESGRGADFVLFLFSFQGVIIDFGVSLICKYFRYYLGLCRFARRGQ